MVQDVRCGPDTARRGRFYASNRNKRRAFPSVNEGFGLVYAEAMRRGLPVVTSVQDAGCEIICDGETGFTVDPADTCSLSQRLSS